LPEIIPAKRERPKLKIKEVVKGRKIVAAPFLKIRSPGRCPIQFEKYGISISKWITRPVRITKNIANERILPIMLQRE
jgi:hypothetical protein